MSFADEPELNLTSMIDLVFFLLIFFMAASRLASGTPEEASVSLPESSTAPEVRDGPARIVVTALAADRFLVGNVKVKADGVAESLRTEARGRSGLRVVVRAEPGARFEAVRTALRAAATAGIPDVIFAAGAPEGGSS